MMPLAQGTWAYSAFRRIVFLKAFSSFGTSMQLVASGWLVYNLTGSAMSVGILALVSLGPSLFGSPIGGILADRFCPRKLATALSALAVIGPGLLAAMAFADLTTVPALYVLSFVGAVPNAISQPIRSIVNPYAVPVDLRHKAVADLSAATNVAQLLGSVSGGVVVQTAGPGWAFLINALSYATNALVYQTSPVLQHACDLAKADRSGGLVSGLRRGWEFDVVRIAILGGVTFFALVAPIEQLMPKLATAHGEGAMMLGILLAALSVGAMVANPFVRRSTTTTTSSSFTLAAGVVLASCASIGLGLVAGLVTDLILLTLVGAAWEMVYVSSSGALQLDVPRDISGRMVGVFFLIVAGALALGAVAVGFLFDEFGVSTTLLGIGCSTLVIGLLLMVFHRRADFLMMAPTMGRPDPEPDRSVA